MRVGSCILLFAVMMAACVRAGDNHSSEPRAAFGQFREPDLQGHGPGHRWAPGKERKRLERLRLVKLLEALELDDDQEDAFINVFLDLRRSQRRISKERMQIIGELADRLRARAAVSEDIYRSVEKVNALDHERRELNQEFLEQAKRILTPEQFGRLFVFEARFELELLGKMAEFHRGQRPPEPPIPHDDLDYHNINGRGPH